MLRCLIPAAGIAACCLCGCSVRGDALLGGSDRGAIRSMPAETETGLLPPPGMPASADETGPRESLASLSRGDLWATWNSLRGDAYPLDAVERFVEPGTHLACDRTRLVRHAGDVIKYRGAVQVDAAFRERLVRFEHVVQELSLEVYGRAPQRLQHFGAYSCRSSRNRSHRLSEHALGNALDVRGFEFGPATKKQPLAPGLPQALRRPFQIQVAAHWERDSVNPSSAVHARFLRELTERLAQRDDVFRVMIGPSQHDHSDHFHFDMSPWHYIKL